VDVGVRELLRSGVSPRRSAVVSRYGGLEHFIYGESERALIGKTFQSPQWYFESSAHYPLTISSVETLRSGMLDTEYNDVGRDYEVSQGVNRRSRCPIYLATKTEVLAIEAALQGHVEKDFYVSDLFDIFRAVKERSKYDEAVWLSPLSNSEFPTPYAYLLHTITSDLEDLPCTAAQATTCSAPQPESEGAASQQVGAPGDVVSALAQAWSFCVWSIADSQHQVSPKFRDGIIEQYLIFILKLGWQPSEIHLGLGGGNVQGLDPWRDLFSKALKGRFEMSDPVRQAALEAAMKSLDQGKHYVFEGSTWLEGELFR